MALTEKNRRLLAIFCDPSQLRYLLLLMPARDYAVRGCGVTRAMSGNSIAPSAHWQVPWTISGARTTYEI